MERESVSLIYSTERIEPDIDSIVDKLLLLRSRRDRILWIVGRGLVSSKALSSLSNMDTSWIDECRTSVLMSIYEKTRREIDKNNNMKLLQRLYMHGFVSRIIYLDIDGVLSEVIDPDTVIEVYGAITRFKCRTCGWQTSIKYVGKVGCTCRKCGDTLRPDIYMNSLPKKIVNEIVFEVTTADIVLVVFLTDDLTTFELLLIALAAYLSHVVLIGEDTPKYLCEILRCSTASFRELAEAVSNSIGDV